jgi:O-antigen/teichoic acid export membrane protein
MSGEDRNNLRRRWFGNSAVNLAGGLATAGVNVLLPAVVVKHLSAESFAVWNLALQMSVYVNLLSLGLQTATARAVAHAADAGPTGMMQLPVIVRAVRSISYWASGAAMLLVAALVVGYPLLFPGVSISLISEFRTTLALFGLAAVLQILAQVDMGIFQGLHQNVVFVGAQTLVKLLTLFVVWLGTMALQPMVVLALLMAGASATLWPTMRIAFSRWVPWAGEVAVAMFDRACRHDLLKYCGTLSVWSVSMLLVNSVGIVIVGRLNLIMAGPYAIAMTASMVLVGLLNALLSPLMTTAAALYSTEESKARLPALLIRSTIGANVGLNAMLMAITVLNSYLLRAWVGESYVSTTGPILIVLVSAHCLRNIGAPYALMLVATGLHQRALLSAAMEGIANMIASVVLGTMYGAIGVAFGTFVGAAVGIIGTILLNVGRTPELTPRPVRFSVQYILFPVLLFLPAHAYLLYKFI